VYAGWSVLLSVSFAHLWSLLTGIGFGGGQYRRRARVSGTLSGLL